MRTKNDVKQLHYPKTFSNSGISASSDLKGENNGSEFLHLVSSYDCCNSICGDFDCKMAKEARCKKTIPRKLNHHSHLFGDCRIKWHMGFLLD